MSDLVPALHPVNIEDEMKRSYMDYAMSVIIGRALPDARDGLKPAHRRVLYGMKTMGLTSSRGYRKCAKIVGEVMGNFHPHGDASIYDTLVRLAQDFNMRYPLVDGQGNFGSIDGDPAAAMRYTEARLQSLADEMMADLDKETVDFTPNYDETTEEPSVLPTPFPNLLVNGSAGIAVGMATNVPPHNLHEVVAGCIWVIENTHLATPEQAAAISRTDKLRQLIKLIPGPDFPTGGYIVGRGGIAQAYLTGRGSILMRAKHDIETNKKGDRQSIVFTAISALIAMLPLPGMSDVLAWKIWSFNASEHLLSVYGIGGSPPERALLRYGANADPQSRGVADAYQAVAVLYPGTPFELEVYRLEAPIRPD